MTTTDDAITEDIRPLMEAVDYLEALCDEGNYREGTSRQHQRTHVASLARALAADARRYRELLRWALDLLDMYDERMVQHGDDPKLVYSEVHVKAKQDARAALSHSAGSGEG